MKKYMFLIVFSVACLFLFNVAVKAETYECYNCNRNSYSKMIVKDEDLNEYNALKLTSSSEFNPNMGQFNSGFGSGDMSCKELLGPTLTKFLKTLRITVQGVGCAIAIANGMITFVPAITSKDASALQKAFEKFVKLLVILALLLLMPTLLKFIGNLAEFDLSCI